MNKSGATKNKHLINSIWNSQEVQEDQEGRGDLVLLQYPYDTQKMKLDSLQEIKMHPWVCKKCIMFITILPLLYIVSNG